MDMIRFNDYSFRYPDAQAYALKHISFSVQSGEFFLICGHSGCGKTTLLRSIKQELAPIGEGSGEIQVFGLPFGQLPPEKSAAKVGFVQQDPDSQIVTDTVAHELAFGLENLGIPSETIRRRVAEISQFFGITSWFHKEVSLLSGGQKQILNLAVVLAMQPEILVLDEPTAQLDPIAAKDLLSMLHRVNRELGVTVIISEHRLEDVLPMADQVIFLEKGKMLLQSDIQKFAGYLYDEQNSFSPALPATVRLIHALGGQMPYPHDIREARQWLSDHPPYPLGEVDVKPSEVKTHPSLWVKDVWFRYGKDEDFALRDMSIQIHPGEIHGILGDNGSGKSTLLSIMAGFYRPQRGKVHLEQGVRTAILPQDPKAMFRGFSLEEDLMAESGRGGYSKQQVLDMADALGFGHLLSRHPHDLSAGEMQKAALAKLLLMRPDVLLLDEPTKGLDIIAKQELAIILKERKSQGNAIVLVTHDIEFAAEVADRCSMLFLGEVICTDICKQFFCGNNFYTTGVNLITRGLLPDCVTIEDVLDHE